MKFLKRQQREAELDAEIRHHLDEAIRDASHAVKRSPACVRLLWPVIRRTAYRNVRGPIVKEGEVETRCGTSGSFIEYQYPT